ncbi:MAG: leucine-rich repeat domain-containing protein [Ruminococcaceae bacterium]|nr:leucine-rich repeat domain-containing protein [Oscillospiraceae bacterium]
MSIKKRVGLTLISFVFIFVFLLSPLAYAAGSETEGKCGPSLTWNYDAASGSLTISGEGPMYDYANFSITVDCAPYSVYRAKIKSVVIEEGCTKIGTYAFSGLTALTLVKFPENSLKEIGAYAFNYCTELTRMIIPDSVTLLGESAFTTCQKLKMIRFGTGITSLPTGICRKASELTDVFLTENIKYIGNAAFYECKKLVNIDISSVEVFEANAFFSCTSLKSVRFGDNIKTIGSNSFYSCSALSEIIFDGTPTAIASAFCYGSPWYNSHDYGMYTICNGEILMCRTPYSASEIVVPEGVKMIADNAFANNASITKVVLPESLEVIGSMAFSRADSLTSIIIPDNVKEIRKNALGYKTQGSSDSIINPNFVITSRGKGVAYAYATQNGINYNCLHEYEIAVQSENCTEAIYSLEKCIYCDIVIEKTALPVKESHDFTETVTTPDCENGGYTLYSCKNCNFSFKDAETSAKGHSSTEIWEIVAEPECEEYGKIALLCSDCGDIISEKLIEKNGHSESGALRTLAAESCTEAGLYEKYCTTCDATLETVTVPAVGHTPAGDYETVIPFETENAGCEMIRCKTCGIAISVRWFVYDGDEKVIIDKSEARNICLAGMAEAFEGTYEVSVSSYDFNFDGILSAKDKLTVKLMTE